MTSHYRERALVGAGRVIQCRWEQHVPAGGSGYVQRVLPDGCADVVVVDGDRAVVAGPARRAAFPELASGTVVAGLRVRTEAVKADFGVPGLELQDRNVPLDEVLGPATARRVVDALRAPEETGDAWLAGWLSVAADRVDGRVAAAVARLRQAAGDVASVADTVGLSSRQLRRVLEAECGMGPKTLQRIGRLHRFLGLAEGWPPGRGGHGGGRDGSGGMGGAGLAGWAAMAGYADQAHLTKDVTELAAITPARLLSERRMVAADDVSCDPILGCDSDRP